MFIEDGDEEDGEIQFFTPFDENTQYTQYKYTHA